MPTTDTHSVEAPAVPTVPEPREVSEGSVPGSFTAVLVAALDAAWAAIQARHPEVPDVIVTVGSGTVGQSAGLVKLGHFAAERWQRRPDDAETGAAGAVRVPELFVGGEGLAAGAASVLATLLHEAGHGLADTRGIKDTSRQGRYHNKQYRDLAVELGLVCENNGAHGWNATRLPAATATEYAATVRALDAALVAWRHAEPGHPTVGPGTGADDGGGDGQHDDEAGGDGDGRKPGRNGVVAVCGCPRQFRITASVLELGEIVCAVCEQPFRDRDTDGKPNDQEQGQ